MFGFESIADPKLKDTEDGTQLPEILADPQHPIEVSLQANDQKIS